MDVKLLLKAFSQSEIEFFAGVPDSQLKALCDGLIQSYGVGDKHLIAANEGNAVALAAGYFLATGKVPLVYMQNSGLGNATNPIVSLTSPKVYGIPTLYMVGWRGEPNLHDEPQHIFQGEITLASLSLLGIQTLVMDKTTTIEQIQVYLQACKPLFAQGKSAAIVVKKGALTVSVEHKYTNPYPLSREEIIEQIVRYSQEDILISTTGKTSRELFEIRKRNHQSGQYDFLTVGSMGHASSIALGVAMYKPQARVWCLDGDGAFIMHMGAGATIASVMPPNLVHVIINNEAHESVGGMPTVAKHMDIPLMGKALGYTYIYQARDKGELDKALKSIVNQPGLTLLEVKSSLVVRDNLGRPDTTAQENKESFMQYLKGAKQ